MLNTQNSKESKIVYVPFTNLSFNSKDKFQKWFLEDTKEKFLLSKKEIEEIEETEFLSNEYEEMLVVDGDYIKCGDSKLYFSIYDNKDNRFFKEKENTKYVLLYDVFEDINDFMTIIEWFLNGRAYEIEIENTWDAFNDVNEGIAYRGGCGYQYALYAKKLNK